MNYLIVWEIDEEIAKNILVYEAKGWKIIYHLRKTKETK